MSFISEVSSSLDKVYQKICYGDAIKRNIEICLMYAKGVPRLDIGNRFVLSQTRTAEIIHTSCGLVYHALCRKNPKYHKLFGRTNPTGRQAIDYKRFISLDGVVIFEYLKQKAEYDEELNKSYPQKINERIRNAQY